MVDIFTYTKNVAKSVLYSGQDVVKQNTPAMESFMSTNKEVLTGLYDMAKDYRTFGKRMQQYVKSSRVYEAATEGAKAIFEDISNGTFYNKERIDRFETKAMGDMANFDDFDSSNFNMDTGDANGGSDDWDFGDTDMESSPNDDVVAAVHLSSKDNAEAVAKVSAKVGANIAATNRANTMLMLNQQIKANSIMEKGFSSIFDRMGEQNAKLNSSIDSLTSKALEYYDKSLTLSQDSNNMLKEVLDLMKANAGIKEGEDKNKKSKLSYSDIVDANGMPDLRAYWQSIKRNAKNALPAEMKTLMGNGIGGEGSNLLLTFVSSPLKVISDTIVKTVIPKMVTKTMSEFDSTLSGAFSGMLAQFNNLAADEDASILKQYLGKIFGVKVRGAETPNPADYKKDAIPFDGITKKAITEVIPGYLRRIESALTGDGERIFSYSTGKWSNARDLRKQYTSIPESAYKSAYADIKEEMMTLILGSGKFSKTDTKSLNENMNKFLKRIVSEDMGNPRKLMSTSIKKGKELYMDYGVDNSELMELLLTALKYTSRGSRAQLAKGAFEAKESIANKIESLIKSNTEMAEIFNGSDTDKGYTWSKDGGKRTKAPGHLYNNTIDKILDDKGHNVFYYLQMMLREMATFRENRYGADMRGGRGRPGGGGGVPPIPQLSNTALTGAYAREVRRARRESISPITVSYDIENVSASRRENEARRNAYYREQEELEKYRKKKGAKPVWDTGDEAAMSSIRSNIKQLSIRAHGDINHSQTNNYDNLYQYLKNSTDFKEYWEANHTILDEFIAEQRQERKDRREQNAELRGGYKNNDEENDYDETDENGNKKKRKKRKGKGIVNKLLEAESLQDKMDVFSEGMDEILEAPGKYLSTIIMKADEAVYNLIFGKEGVKNNKTGKEANGILDAMVIGIQNTFEKVNNWLDEKILDPIKKKLGIETFGDAVQKFFGIFGIDFNGTRDNIVDWLFKDNSIVKDIRQNIQQSWEDLMESISPGQSAQDAARAQARTDAQAVDAAITNRSATGIAPRSNRNYDIAMATGRASVPRTKAKTYENYRELERTSNGRKWIRQYCLDNGIELPLTEVNYRKLAKAEVDSSNPLPSNPSSADKTRYQNDVRTAEARYLTRLHDIQVQIVNTYNQQKQDEAALQDRLRPYNEDEQFKDTADKLLGKSSLGYMMRVTEEEKSQGITKVNSIDRLSELYKLGDDTTYLKLKASPVGRLFIDNYCKVHETGPIDRMSREDAKKVQRAIVEEFNNYARTGFNNMLDMIDEDITLTEGQKRGMRERIKNGNNDWAKRRGEIYNRFDVNNPNIDIPMIDANGNIVRDANGNIVTTTRQATDAEQARRISRLTDYKRRGLDEANAFLDLINGISGRTADNIENKSKEWNINFNAIEKGGLDADAEIRRLFDILPNEYRSRLVEGTRLLGTIRLGDTNAQMDQYNAAGSAGITKVLNELRAIDTAEQNKTKSQMGSFNKKNAEDLTTAMFNYLRTRDPEYLKDADGNFIYDEIEKINSDTGEKYISKEKRRNADYKSDSEIKAYILRDIFGTELNLDSFATEEDKNKEIDRLYRQIKVNPELLDRLKEKFKGELGFLGSLARGSRLVTKTGLYTIHKGEAVVPSEYVPRSINGQTPGGISKQKEIDDENRVKNRYLAYLGRRIGSAAGSNVVAEEVPENLQAQTTEVPNQNENPNKARKVRELKKFTGEEIYQKTLQPLNKILRDSMGDEAADKLKSNFEKFAAPGIGGGIVGGGVGLASSLVFGLAGGPIIGAAVGAAANIAKNSETFSKFLFGEKIEGQYDNGAQKRAGGLFSLETQEAWHKYFPSMAKWGAGSAVAGLFTPLGPIGGLMVGSAIGFIKKNEDFQGLLFGENGLFREEDKEKFKKALPAGIAGSAIGAIALSGPFGLLGGAAVGALGGIASTTETFKRIMLGKETQVGVDKDGKPIMKRQGGIIGTIAKISLEPIKQGAIFIKTTVTDFVKKDIVAPLKSAVKPIGNMFRNMFTEIKEGITGTLNNFFEKRLGVPVEEFIKDRIFAPIGNTAKNILKFPFKLLGGAISLPFKTLGFIGNNIRANQIKRGTDNGSTAAERLDWRDNHKIRSKKIFGFGLNIDGFRKADEWINSASSADIESLRRDLSLWNDKDANYRELAKVRKEDIAGSVNEFFDDKKHGGFFTKNNHARKRILELIRDDKYEEAYKLIRTLKGRDGQPLDPQQVETLINQLQNQVQLYNDVKAGRGADANYRRTMTEKLASLGFKDTLGKTNVNKIIRMLDSEKAGRKKQGLWDEGTEEMLNQGKANTQDIVSAINALTDKTVDFYNALVNGNYTEGALSKDDVAVIGKGTARRVNSAKEAQDRNRQKKNNRVEEAGNATINSVMKDDETTKEGLKKKFNFGDDFLKKINTNDPESIKRVNELGKYCYGSKGAGNKAGISQDGIAEAIKLSNNKYRIVEMYAKAKYFPMDGEFVKFLADNVGRARVPIITYITSLGESKVKILMKGNTQRAHMTFIKDVVPYLVDKKNFRKYINEYISDPTAYNTMDLKEFIKRGGVYGLETGETAVVSRGEVIVDSIDDIPQYATGHTPDDFDNRGYLENIFKGVSDKYNNYNENSSSIRSQVNSQARATVKNIKSGSLIRRKRWDKALSDNSFENSIANYNYELANVKYMNRLRALSKKKHPKLTREEITWLTNTFDIDYAAYADTKNGINNRALASHEIDSLKDLYAYKSRNNMTDARKTYMGDSQSEIYKDESGNAILDDDGNTISMTGAQSVYNKLLSGQKVAGFRVKKKNRNKLYGLLSEYTSFADDAELTDAEKQQKQDRQTQIFEDIKTLLSYNVNDDGAALKKMIDKNGKVYVNKLDPENKDALKEGRVNNLALEALNKIAESAGNIKGFFTDKVDGERSRLDIFTDNAKKLGKYVLSGLAVAGGLTALVQTIAPNVSSAIGEWWEVSGKPTFENVKNGVSTWVTKDLPEMATNIWDSTKGKVTEFVNNLWKDMSIIGAALGEGVATTVGWVVQATPYILKGLWNGVRTVTGLDNDITTGNTLEAHLGTVALESIIRGSSGRGLKNLNIKLPGATGKIITAPINTLAHGTGNIIDFTGGISRGIGRTWGDHSAALAIKNAGTTMAELSPDYLGWATRDLYRNTDYTDKIISSVTNPDGSKQILASSDETLQKLYRQYGEKAVDDVVLKAAENGGRITTTALREATQNTTREAAEGIITDATSKALQNTYKDASKNLTEEAANKLISKQGLTKTVGSLSTKQYKKMVFNVITDTSADIGVKTITDVSKNLSKTKIMAPIVEMLTKWAAGGRKTIASVVGDVIADKATSPGFLKKFATCIVDFLAEKVSNGLARMAASLASAGIVDIVFAVYDFIWPWLSDANAMEILGITQTPTFGQKFFAALLNCIMGLPFMAYGLIPPAFVSYVLFDVIGLDFFGIKEARDKSTEEYNAFLKHYDMTEADLSFDDYSYMMGNHRIGIIDSTAQAIGGGEEGMLKRINEERVKNGKTELTLDQFHNWESDYNSGSIISQPEASGTATVVNSDASIGQQILDSLNMLVAYMTGKNPETTNAAQYYTNGSESSQFSSDVATAGELMYNDLISQGYSADEAAMLASGYGYGAGSGRYSQRDKSINMRFNKPTDSVYQDINTSGCGPIAATNLINRNIKYGIGMVDPQDAAKYALNGGYKETNGGTDPRYFTSYFKKNGINSTITSSHNAMRSAIRNGQQVVLMGKDTSYGMGSTPYGPNPHYVVATGMSGKNLIVDNPESENEYSLYNADDTIKKSSKAIITNSSIKYGMGSIASPDDPTASGLYDAVKSYVDYDTTIGYGDALYKGNRIHLGTNVDNINEDITNLITGKSAIGLFKNRVPFTDKNAMYRDPYEEEISRVYNNLSANDKQVILNLIPKISAWAISRNNSQEAADLQNDISSSTAKYTYKTMMSRLNDKSDISAQLNNSDPSLFFKSTIRNNTSYDVYDNIYKLLGSIVRYIDGIARFNSINTAAKGLANKIIENQDVYSGLFASTYSRISDLAYQLAYFHPDSGKDAIDYKAIEQYIGFLPESALSNMYNNDSVGVRDRLKNESEDLITTGFRNAMQYLAAELFYKIGSRMYNVTDYNDTATTDSVFKDYDTALSEVGDIETAISNVYSDYPEYLSQTGFKKLMLHYLFGSDKLLSSTTDNTINARRILSNIGITMGDKIPEVSDLDNKYNNDLTLASVYAKILRGFAPDSYIRPETFSYESFINDEGKDSLSNMITYLGSDKYNIEDYIIEQLRKNKTSPNDYVKEAIPKVQELLNSPTSSSGDYGIDTNKFKTIFADYATKDILDGDATRILNTNDIKFIKQFADYLLSARVKSLDDNSDEYKTFSDVYYDRENDSVGAIAIKRFINMTKSNKFVPGILYNAYSDKQIDYGNGNRKWVSGKFRFDNYGSIVEGRQGDVVMSPAEILDEIHSLIIDRQSMINGKLESNSSFMLGKSGSEMITSGIASANENSKYESSGSFNTRVSKFESLPGQNAIMLRVLAEERDNANKASTPLEIIRSGIASAGLIDPKIFEAIYLNKYFYDEKDSGKPDSYVTTGYNNSSVIGSSKKKYLDSMFKVFGYGENYTDSSEFMSEYSSDPINLYGKKVGAMPAVVANYYYDHILPRMVSANIPTDKRLEYYEDLSALNHIFARDVYGTNVTGLADKYNNKTYLDMLELIGTNYIDLKRAKNNKFYDMINALKNEDITIWNPNATNELKSPDGPIGGESANGSKISETGDVIDVKGLGSELDEYMFRDITKFSPLSPEAIRTFIDKRVNNSGYGAYSPFREHISYIIELGNTYGIDPRVALAIMTTEEGLCCNEYGAKHLAKCNYISIMRSVKDDEEVGAGTMADFSTGGTRTIGEVIFNLGSAKDPESSEGIKMGLKIVFKFLKDVSVNKRDQKSLFSLNFKPGYVFCGTIDWINTTISILKQIDALDPNTKISYVQPTTDELQYYKSLTGTALNTDCIPEGSESTSAGFFGLLRNLANAVFGEDLWNFFTNGFGIASTSKTTKNSKVSTFDPNRVYSGLSDIFKNGLMEGTVVAPSVPDGGNFGPRYIKGGLSYHKGIDITSSNKTTPIGSPVDGEVLDVTNNVPEGQNYYNGGKGYGNRVLILDDNPNGRRIHLFGHLSKVKVKPGDTIRRGDEIGNMGDTGYSLGHHLHYGVNIPDANNNIDDNYNIEEKTINGVYNDMNKNTDMSGDHPFTSLPDSLFSRNTGWINPELYLNNYLSNKNKIAEELYGSTTKSNNTTSDSSSVSSGEEAYLSLTQKKMSGEISGSDTAVYDDLLYGQGSGRTLADQMIIDNINENGISGIGGADRLSTTEQARIRKAITTIKERDAAKHTSKPVYGMGSGGVGGAPTSISTTNNATDEKLLASNNSQVELLLVISQTLKSIEETSRQNNVLVAAIMEAVRRGEISTDSETYKALLRSLNNSSNGSGSDTTSVLVNSMMSIARS